MFLNYAHLDVTTVISPVGLWDPVLKVKGTVISTSCQAKLAKQEEFNGCSAHKQTSPNDIKC